MKGNRLIILSTAMILIGTLIPSGGSVSVGFQFDKIVHLAMFFILGGSILISIKDNTRAHQALLLASLFGMLIEVTQQFIPGRGMSLYDAIADTAGLIIAMAVYSSSKVRNSRFIRFLGRINGNISD